MTREFLGVIGDAKKFVAVHSAGGGSILLAEDNEFNRQIAEEILRSAGFVVEVAENGQVAVEKFFLRTFDVVLMDIQMPVMDGPAATEELRRRGCRMPIIALTANIAQADRDRCAQSGMNDFLTKPLDPRFAIQIIDNWIAKARAVEHESIAENCALAAKRSAPRDSKAAETKTPKTRVENLDIAVLEEIFGEDTTKIAEVLWSSVGDIEPKLIAAQSLVESGDMQQLLNLAHSIKGSALIVGANKLAFRAIELEEAAESGFSENCRSSLAATKAAAEELFGIIEYKFGSQRLS